MAVYSTVSTSFSMSLSVAMSVGAGVGLPGRVSATPTARTVMSVGVRVFLTPLLGYPVSRFLAR